MEEAVKIKFEALESANDRQNKRIDLLEEDLKELKRIALSVEKLAIQMEQMTKTQTKLTKDVEEIKNRPAAAWNTMTRTFFTTIVSAIAGGIVVMVVQSLAKYM